MSSDPRTSNIDARRTEIRNAMLARAASRRRARICRDSSLVFACVAATVGVAWFSLNSVSYVPTTPETSPHADAQFPRTDDQEAFIQHATVATLTPLHNQSKPGGIISRAISDHELLDLLQEAGEPAGLAIIDGKALLIPLSAAPNQNGAG